MTNGTPPTNEAPQWYEFVMNFDRTYSVFMTNYDALLKIGPFVARHPELQSEYDRLVNTGADNYNKLIQLKATRDYIASWLNWFNGGARGVFEWIGSGIGLNSAGLGVAFLIPLITLGAATATLIAIGYFNSDMATFAERTNLTMDLERSGKYTPGQITDLVNGTLGKPGGGMFAGINNSIQMLAFAAIAVFIGPPIIRALTGERK